MANPRTQIDCVLLTWHGTLVSAGPQGTLTQDPVLDADALTRGCRLNVDCEGDPQLWELFPFPGELRYASEQLGEGLARAAPNGRGYNISRDGHLLCAQRDSPPVAWDREHAGDWESFLPLPVSLLAKLLALQRYRLFDGSSGEAIAGETLAFRGDFQFVVGAFSLDLTKARPLFLIDDKSRVDGKSPVDRTNTPIPPKAFILFQGDKVTAFTPLIGQATVPPKRVWLRDAAYEPKHIHGPAGQPMDAYAEEAAVLDTGEVLYYPPAFADRKDREFFVKKSWTHRPRLGYTKARVTPKRADNAYVFLARGLEGLIFDAHGVYKDWGYLTVCNHLPAGITKEGERYLLDSSVMNDAPVMPGEFAIFYNGNFQSYYHFMAEGILSLFALQKFMPGRPRVVLPAALEGIENHLQYLEILRLFSFGDLDVTFSSAPLVRLERSTWIDPGYLAQDYPDHLLKEFQAAAAAAVGAPRPPTRIYVERATTRGVANAQEVRDCLETLGFLTVKLETLPVLEQARLFASADFVIATHGAGLTNLMFAPPTARVLELMPDAEMRPFFWYISQKLGHEYGMMACPTDTGAFNGKLIVDMSKLMRLFALLEKA